MTRHNYTTCNRCEASDANTPGAFRQVTGTTQLDLCPPCWDLFQVWVANEDPAPSARKEPAPTKQSASIGNARAAADARNE